MAGLMGKSAVGTVLKVQTCQKFPVVRMSNQSRAETFKNFMKSSRLRWVTGAAVGSALAVGTAVAASVSADGLEIHPIKLPWSHHGAFASLDHASMRRGWQVYKQVCAACHSLEELCYRELVDSVLTLEEAKAEAAEAQILDGPNDVGEMFLRPGKLTDKIVRPYANDNEARNANGGALPPDLTYIVLGREGNEDYIFSLLTGYCDPPKGVEPMPDLHYNPYFTGGWIAMAQALYNEIIEYEDGTPATQSQLAKDITTFLTWTGQPDFDTRKKMTAKAIPMALFAIAVIMIGKRLRFNVIRTSMNKMQDVTSKKK